MILEQLDNELRDCLQDAKQVYVAVALLKPYGFQAIEDSLVSVADTCVRKYLVGINLPTSASVLRTALKIQEEQQGRFFAKVYRAPRTFHPKVYLIRKSDNSLVGFVGSANATRGGLLNNVELTVKIEGPECDDLLVWFNGQFEAGDFYDEAFIVRYEELLRRNKRHNAAIKSNIDSILNEQGGNRNAENLNVNEGQFFRQRDFDAFSEAFHLDHSSEAVDSRREVRDRLRQLGNMIFPRFLEFGIDNLHRAERLNNQTSYHWHTGRSLNRPLDAIWLNYGKSGEELQRYPNDGHLNKFGNNARIQTILLNRDRLAYIGNWLVLGKGYGSNEDRINLKNRLMESEEFSRVLFDYVQQLGASFEIALNREDIPVSDFKTHQELRNKLLEDQYQGYLIIGRERAPNSPDLSVERIVETVLNDYAGLYRIYDLVRHRPD